MINQTKSRRAAWVAALVATSLFLFGCNIILISGPTVVAINDTVVYVLEATSTPGMDPTPRVIAEVPAGWQVVSISYSGEVDGQPVSGSGMVVGSGPCGFSSLPADFQRIFMEPDGPLVVSTTAQITIEFMVTDQPTGAYDITFLLGTGDGCSPPAVASINRENPFLSLAQSFFDGVDGVDGLAGAGQVELSPNQDHLYVAGSLDSSVAIFTYDDETGALAFQENVAQNEGVIVGLAMPLGLEISPDGDHLYVASLSNPDTSEQGGLLLFTRDQTTGTLTFVERLFEDVQHLGISNDGEYLYASGGGVTLYDRNAVTGELGFQGTVFPGGQLSFSPQQEHLYTVGESGGGAFSRDEVSGELTQVGAATRGSGGVLSPDGRHLYEVELESNVFSIFSRDAMTGELTLIMEASLGEPALDDFQAVAVSPSGSHVVIGGTSAIRVFERNKATGALTLVESYYSLNLPFQELTGPQSLSFSPDGRFLFVTSLANDGLARFETGIVFTDGFESGTTSSWSSEEPPQ